MLRSWDNCSGDSSPNKGLSVGMQAAMMETPISIMVKNCHVEIITEQTSASDHEQVWLRSY